MNSGLVIPGIPSGEKEDAMLLGSSQCSPAQRAKTRARRRGAISRACCEALECRRLLNFAPAASYATAADPKDVVTADFNNDGKLDLASVNAGSSNVTVRLGDGAGGFGAATNFPTGAGPNCMVVGDFNNDTKPDLVTGSYTGENVSVLLGNGNGSFAAPIHSEVYAAPLSLAVGDVGQDGKMDLLVGGVQEDYYYGYETGVVAVLVGNGTGSLFASTWYNVGNLPYDIGAADLSGDGILDFATTYDDGYTGAVAVLLRGANVTLKFYQTGDHPGSLAFGDFTGDGKLDIITAGSTLAILPGNGLGAFTFPIDQPTNGGPYTSVATGDFNNDGKLDAVATDVVNNAINVLLGNGSGALTLSAVLPTGMSPISVAVGNFNADGRLDVATANPASNNLSVLLNDGNWSTLPPALRINDVSVVEGNSGTVNAVFTVTLDRGPASGNVTVNFNTENFGGDIDPTPWNSATAGSDYVATSGALTFLPGQTTKTISVPVKGDTAGEYDEKFLVRLSGATIAQIFDPTGVGTITDDEPRLNIASSVTVTEGDSGTTPMNFIVTLSVPSSQTVTVDYGLYGDYRSTAQPGSDYDSVFGTLTFLPGQTSKTITVPIRGDLMDENDEFLYVYLINSTNAVILNWEGEGKIIDNDAPPAIVISDVSRAEGNSGTTPFQFTVSLLTPTGKAVSVSYGTAAGTATNSGGNPDYQSKSGTLNFGPGQTSQTVTVSVFGDTRNESDETFFVNLSSPTNATIADAQGIATILNDESRGKTWVGPASGGSWSTAGNWSPTGVPTADSLVTIAGAAVTLPASATVSELSLKTGASLTIATNGNRVLRTSALFLDAADAKLNLSDNDMILDYAAGNSPIGVWNGWTGYSGVSGMIARGFNFGAWDGSGLVTTTSAARAGVTTLASAEARELLGITGTQTALWDGQTVDATTILVKYTYAGDANLDGAINGGDYGIIDNFVQVPGAWGYFNGDFNHDGVIDGGDYGILDNNVQAQGAPL
jgi:hypothetical protein